MGTLYPDQTEHTPRPQHRALDTLDALDRLDVLIDLLGSIPCRAAPLTPLPGEVLIPGGDGAHGRLMQWTCEDGHVERAAAGAIPCSIDDVRGIVHIGIGLTCHYVSESFDYGALVYATFDDGLRTYVYARDCVFD